VASLNDVPVSEMDHAWHDGIFHMRVFLDNIIATPAFMIACDEDD
jgi:hypothetical protein